MMDRGKMPQKRYSTAGNLAKSQKFSDLCVDGFRETLSDVNIRFGNRIYISMKEAAAMLGICVKTLKGHVDLGNIEFSKVGHGRKKIRRMFTARHLADFCHRANDRLTPVPPRDA